ncbi:hypothetical protein L3X38_036256 [Prunus dulcis]|uniref:Uncharacterized protein n=1 Tax=Prunus dulcis TaxID=3755 RepID=A0AAD4V2E2_PRUDU|nr:hypothetical protein L3X38_036256 [Prunus dulcis]
MILSALGPPLCPHGFVSGNSRATSQWVTHPGIAVAPNLLNFGVPTTPKPEHHFQRPRYWVEFLKTTVHTEVKLYRVRSDSPLTHYSEGNETFVFNFDEIVLKNLSRQSQSATIHPPPPHTGGC